MKKFILVLFILFSHINLFAQDFPFPPELKWWLDEIQSIDKNAEIEKFRFSEERFILNEDAPISYKNRLYPVLKKWNYFGNEFAYYDILAYLKKNKNGKYSLYGKPDSAFGIFDKNETLLFYRFLWKLRMNRFILLGKRQQNYCSR